jgi:imidazole glycerol-phosphate synthase subunit HisH
MSRRVAIIDYGVGNLFSVAQACRHAGLEAVVTHDATVARDAHGLILPGVGAFGYAMQQLENLGMVAVLQEAAKSGKPLFGICLGFQLLFESSSELGHAPGLSLIPGRVAPLAPALSGIGAGDIARIPNIAWLPIEPAKHLAKRNDPWAEHFLAGVTPGSSMYFVHSYFAMPALESDGVAASHYCGFDFCSAVARDNIFGCQFHPEKSGDAGLRLYHNFAQAVAIT